MRNMMIRFFLLMGVMCCMVAVVNGQQDTLNKLDKNGKKHGYWVKSERDTLLYEGRFDHGDPTGLFVYYYPDKKIKSTVEYTQKGKEARAVMYHPNGAMMAVGRYWQQKKDSTWKYFSEAERVIAIEHYQKGVAHGEWLKYNHEGKIIEKIVYVNGQKNGEWLQYFDDGKIKIKAIYQNDLLNGSFMLYYSSGTFCIAGKYENSIPVGTWIHYNIKGEIEKKETYKDGKKVKTEQLLPVVEPDSPEAKREVEVMRYQMKTLGIE